MSDQNKRESDRKAWRRLRCHMWILRGLVYFVAGGLLVQMYASGMRLFGADEALHNHAVARFGIIALLLCVGVLSGAIECICKKFEEEAAETEEELP